MRSRSNPIQTFLHLHPLVATCSASLSPVAILLLLYPRPLNTVIPPPCDRVSSSGAMFSQPRRCLVTQCEPKADHDDCQKYINPAHINPILGISRQRRSISSFPIVADSYDQESGRNGMTGGVLYETSTMQDSQQDWMTGRIPRSAHDKQK